jgi:hypothetical protein
LTTLSEYWLTIEKYTNNKAKDSHIISADYLYLKTACLSYSTSLSKPIELIKLGIHQMFKNTRKKLEPVSQVALDDLDADFEIACKQDLSGGVQKDH